MITRKSTPPAVANYPYAQDRKLFERMDRVIQANLRQFRKAGVLSVRPGYKSVGGWLTRKPAIVVTVSSKRDVPAAQRLPLKVGGFSIDVRQVSPVERLRMDHPAEYLQVAASREEFALSDAPLERDPRDGQPLSAALALLTSGAAKPEIAYTGAPGKQLAEVNAPMAVLCHASPDAGWGQLQRFFDQIQTSLTVGLYDFTSAHILTRLKKALTGQGASLTLTLDHPAENSTADQTDEETEQNLAEALGKTLAFEWALVRSSPEAATWIYPTAYHIKVAVRDGDAFWLSSGNWNNSNQPDIDPLKDPKGSAATAKKSDRDWHIIVEHAGLAKTYEAYLAHDNQVASKQASMSPTAVPMGAALTPRQLSALSPVVTLAGRAPQQYFAPKRIPAAGQRNIRAQPILTPDNYTQHVLPLIQSAKTSFHMQTQYIHPSDKAGDQGFVDLINAIISLQHGGKDVRLILSQYQVMGDWLDRLQATGLDLASVRIQSGVHNKGIVVDSKVVMLGSQNWSGDGVLRNRDASLIVYDQEAAQYYEEIFLHDWVHMAKQGS